AFRPVGAQMLDDWLAWGNDRNQVVLRRRVNAPGPNDLFVLEELDGPIRCLAFSGDGSTLAVGCASGHVVFYTFRKDGMPIVNAPPTRLATEKVGNVSVTTVALNRDGDRLLYGLADGQVGQVVLDGNPKPKAKVTVLPREHSSEIRSV